MLYPQLWQNEFIMAWVNMNPAIKKGRDMSPALLNHSVVIPLYLFLLSTFSAITFLAHSSYLL
jgi:hypothetical protein